MLRTVFDAVATACRAASLHDLGLVPTISRMMITPNAHLLVFPFVGLEAAMMPRGRMAPGAVRSVSQSWRAAQRYASGSSGRIGRTARMYGLASEPLMGVPND